MQRERAVEVVNQILESGYAKSITLLLGKRQDDWQIKLQNHDDVAYSCMCRIARENGLAIKKVESSIVMYKP